MDLLFIGNGLNRVSADMSWAAVLRELVPRRAAGAPDTVSAALPARFVDSLAAKPFTLAFEELCFLTAEHGLADDGAPVGDLEATLKRRVAENIGSLPHNDLHVQAMATVADAAARAPQHIITTNYDYNLELGGQAASGLDFGASDTDETKYSLRRRRRATASGGGEVNVWHIHGEVDAPRTLMLSHDHYVRYINRMRRHVPAEPGDEGDNGPGASGSRQRDEPPLTWVSLFLTGNVHVVGFGFDYTEIELWWLLSLKRREALQGKRVGSTTYYPAVAPDSDYTKAREQILASYGVQIDGVYRSDTHEAGYRRFLEAWTKRARR